MGVQTAQTFDDCMNICDLAAGCVDVSLSGTACYLKNGIGNPNLNANIWGARRIKGCTELTPKLKLHRKRVAPFKKQKLDNNAKRTILPYAGPDATFTQGHVTTTQTSTNYVTVAT